MLEDIHKAVDVLHKGGIILYPTDTVWGIGCDATNYEAVKKLNRIKGDVRQRSFIVLVESVDKLKKYVSKIPDTVHDLIENVKEPITIVYPGATNLAKNVMASDLSVAVRIPRSEFCQRLLADFGKPITSSTARLDGDPLPVSFSKISSAILSGVDYVVKYEQQVLFRSKPSIIVCINELGEIQILRN
ncbi:MAG TPA: L-threonylcarbamoyladenylate synthase [Bacteroidales bacterium]|nr:L-threonylcarbamoyladenylate synthase [Bacteroidales bacterium]